ncbi:hypothetical protein ACVBEG_26740 [Pseudomonas sp. GG8]
MRIADADGFLLQRLDQADCTGFTCPVAVLAAPLDQFFLLFIQQETVGQFQIPARRAR